MKQYIYKGFLPYNIDFCTLLLRYYDGNKSGNYKINSILRLHVYIIIVIIFIFMLNKISI